MAPACAALVIAAVVHSVPITATTPECKRFDEIYATGKELCENMWNDAFVYEEDEAKAYTMWFWAKSNPNDKISRDLGLLTGDHEVCHLDYFHKDTPGPEPEGFTECHPWKDNACCSHQTVMSATKLKEGYGAEYHWDRCGPLSPECERFFVQEACFYECDPNAGLFRKWNATEYDPKCDAYAAEYDEAFATGQGCNHNKWQMHKMPIKASYCDAWLTACAKDKFCAADDGDYFTCAKHYEVVDMAAELEKKRKELEELQASSELEIENYTLELGNTKKELEKLQAENAAELEEKKKELEQMQATKNELEKLQAENAGLKAENAKMIELSSGFKSEMNCKIVNVFMVLSSVILQLARE